jgi:hypothetical protein
MNSNIHTELVTLYHYCLLCCTCWRANAASGYSAAVERTEPSASTRAAVEDQWYQRINQECGCAGTTKCGTKLKAIVAGVRAEKTALGTAQRQNCTAC